MRTLPQARCRLGSAELLLLRAKGFDLRPSWQHLLKYRVHVLSCAGYRFHSCTRPVVWGLFTENVNFFIIVYMMSGVILFLRTPVTFTKAVDYVELCGFSVWFCFWYFGSYAFENLTVSGTRKVRFASYFSTLVGGQKYRGFLVASLRSRVD